MSGYNKGIYNKGTMIAILRQISTSKFKIMLPTNRQRWQHKPRSGAQIANLQRQISKISARAKCHAVMSTHPQSEALNRSECVPAHCSPGMWGRRESPTCVGAGQPARAVLSFICVRYVGMPCFSTGAIPTCRTAAAAAFRILIPSALRPAPTDKASARTLAPQPRETVPLSVLGCPIRVPRLWRSGTPSLPRRSLLCARRPRRPFVRVSAVSAAGELPSHTSRRHWAFHGGHSTCEARGLRACKGRVIQDTGAHLCLIPRSELAPSLPPPRSGRPASPRAFRGTFLRGRVLAALC